MERLAQYIVRNPFSVEKMQPDSSGDSIIYRSGMNPKLGRNFEVLSPCDFIARITQHIPGKSFQLVRYYGWYPNKMRGQVRGQRLKREDAETGAMPAEGAVIEISEPKPRRIPSKKWRELIKKVWEAAGRLTLKARSGSVWACKSPLPASNSGPTPRRAESDFLSENHSL
jgi:hypothetical protein